MGATEAEKRSMLNRLSKQVLVAMIIRNFPWFSKIDILRAQHDIADAKCKELWAEYRAFLVPEKSFGTAKYYEVLAERQRIYERYEREMKRVDRLWKAERREIENVGKSNADQS